MPAFGQRSGSSPGPGAWLILSLLGCALGCDRAERLKLPAETFTADLGFGVLYRDDGTVATVGAVVRRQAIAAGRYSLFGEGSGLEARLAFVTVDTLLASARAACEGRASPLERAACRARVDACADDPAACLSPVEAKDRCGARLELGDAVELQVLVPDGKGGLTLNAPAAVERALPGVRLCGPEVLPPCPLRLPGFAVSEGGELRCLAPSRQDRCSLSVDLSACGLGVLEGELDRSGALSARRGRCSVEPLGTADVTIGGGPGLALVCGERRLVASAMDELLGEAGCARRAPGCFRSEGDEEGVISGFARLDPPGQASPVAVFVGAGYDDCAATGCATARATCAEDCSRTCLALVDIPTCAETDWATCQAFDISTDCIRRCRAFCERSTFSCDEVSGSLVTFSPLEAPEVDLSRVRFESGGNRATTGSHALVAQGRGLDSVLLAANRGSVMAIAQALGGDSFEAVARLPLELEIGGLLPHPSRPDAALVFGREPLTRRAALLELRFDDSPAALTPSGPARSWEGLSGADLAALAGARGELVVLGTRARGSGADRGARLLAVPVSGPGPATPISLAGRPRALASLPGGALAIGVEVEGGDHELLLVLFEDGRVARSLRVALARGLVPTAFLADPELCAGPSGACPVYVALERTHEAAPALVGLFRFDPANPEASRLSAAMVETASQELSLLVADFDAAPREPASRTPRRILAIARERNVITPITLAR
jgi:hypothetical protein